MHKLTAMCLVRVEVDRGIGAPGDEAAPYVAVGTLWFTDAEGIEEGLAEHGEEAHRCVGCSTLPATRELSNVAISRQ